VLDGEDKRLIARSDYRTLERTYRTTTNQLELQFLSDYSIAEKGFFAVVSIGPGMAIINLEGYHCQNCFDKS